jgi:hypothetical protein
VRAACGSNERQPPLGDHDDLVLAVALACWLGEKLGGPLQVSPTDPKATSLVGNIPADVFLPESLKPAAWGHG